MIMLQTIAAFAFLCLIRKVISDGTYVACSCVAQCDQGYSFHNHKEIIFEDHMPAKSAMLTPKDVYVIFLYMNTLRTNAVFLFLCLLMKVHSDGACVTCSCL